MLLKGNGQKALPFRLSRQSLPKHFGRCERDPDWRIYRVFAQLLILIAKDLYAGEDFGVDLDETVYALDASTIDLCLSVFPWARFRKTKSAVKLHTLLDLRGNIPSFVDITDGKVHNVNVLDILIPDVGAIYVMDRGHLDFERLFSLSARSQTPSYTVCIRAL